MSKAKIGRAERKAWAGEHFRGLENVLMPSFSADMQVLNEEGIRLDVRQSINHGFFSSLCALESGLSDEEKRRMLAVAADEAGSDIGIALSLAGESAGENIELLEYAESIGASHALLSYPQGFQPKSQDEVYDFVKQVADATNLGIYLFVSDKFSFHHLHPSGVPFDAYERLADLDNIIAMKLGGMDAGMLLECCERFHERLLITSVNLGMLPMLAQTFGIQWSGAWTVEALQSPDKPYIVNFMNHLAANEFEKAMEIYWRITPALTSMIRCMMPILPTGTYHWPMLKFQQWLSGGNGGMIRQPCMRLFERDMQGIRAGLEAIGITCADSNDDFFRSRTTAGVPST